MSGLGADFDRAQWAYEHREPPEAPDCGCAEDATHARWCQYEASNGVVPCDCNGHDPQACLDDQREAALEAKAEQMREDEILDYEDLRP